jgi:hypothetical protein
MVPENGLEPLLPKKPDFESSVSTNSTTRALKLIQLYTTFTNERQASQTVELKR